MNFIDNENPLATQIILTDHEKKELWYKVKIAQMEDLLCDTHFYIKEGNLESALEESQTDYYYGNGLNERCDELCNHLIESLLSHHVGDCTCAPSSCSKCHAEALLGINTIEGLDVHAGYQISEAFRLYKTKNEVLELLQKKSIKAYEWLLNYENQR